MSLGGTSTKSISAIWPTVVFQSCPRFGLNASIQISFRNLIERIGTEEIVLKPIVGANASGTFRISARGGRDQADELSAWFTNRALMAQPFLSAITTEGEFSLFYFNGEHSHTILKTPKPADF